MKYDLTDKSPAFLYERRADLKKERRGVSRELQETLRRLGVLAARRHDIEENLRAIKYALDVQA